MALEKQRAALREMLSQGLMNPIVALINKEGYDKSPIVHRTINHSKHYAFGMHDSLQVSAYLRELRRLKLWPLDLHRMSIAAVIEDLYRFEEKEIGPSMGFRMHGRVHDCWACIFDPRNKIDQLIGQVKDGAIGICLDCLWVGSVEKCRLGHT